MSIVESVAAFMLADPDISALTTDIRPQVLSDGHADPAATYQMVTDVSIRHLTGISDLRRAIVDVSCYSHTYAGAHQLSGTVRQSFEDYSGVFGSHNAQQIDIDTELDRFETTTKLHSVLITLSIWYDNGG